MSLGVRPRINTCQVQKWKLGGEQRWLVGWTWFMTITFILPGLLASGDGMD
jgi:hypothetical protein